MSLDKLFNFYASVFSSVQHRHSDSYYFNRVVKIKLVYSFKELEQYLINVSCNNNYYFNYYCNYLFTVFWEYLLLLFLLIWIQLENISFVSTECKALFYTHGDGKTYAKYFLLSMNLECEEYLLFKENSLHLLDQVFLEDFSECGVSHVVACLTRL